MFISELIEVLEQRKQQFGDLEVVVRDEVGSYVEILENEIYESAEQLVFDAD